MRNQTHTLLLIVFICTQATLWAQSDSKALSDAVQQLKFRSIGPALMGGRIADIAVSQADPNTWYVAVGSGGLWKTTNRGITWQPVFDKQPSYSIGAVAIDPSNASVVWVGTGENVSGRHVGWGSGLYLSLDAGATWEATGLATSEHIGKILIDPRNSDIVYVAAEGPLWSAGGDRGLYKTVDRGQTWEKVLTIDENTGVTDVEFDPSNPDVLYAAAYQRRRHTWSLLGGGPMSGIYKSTDAGASWRQIKTGLPSGDMGKIGLAVTVANPNLVYATIEANDEQKGFYRSLDKGESWEKRNSYISGGTGPHYYQEIEASPIDQDLVYQMDVFLHVTRDGGETFDYLGTGRAKHSDNHALWIDPHDREHLLAGTDAGLYETFDEGITWRHFPNLPVSQFYKMALDNASPFYNISGGAQDLGTLIGPSRTMNIEGIRNQDWYVPLGADGYDTQFDPTDPNIVYMEIQQGELHRLDRRNEEVLHIKPQAGPNDPPERWNWDSPVLISPHNPNRLYFGSQRVWRSDDRGDSWSAISEDLTTNTNRYELALMGRVWSTDDLYDNGAMSKYATLTNISESPLVEGLIYTGSDDGLVHVSENAGDNWQPVTPTGIPERSFINDIEASSHVEDRVYAIVDAHKFGDYRPLLYVSENRGNSWRSIAGNLPATTIVWILKEDPMDPNLLFIGTEYGIYFSPDRGNQWIRLNGGVPTIPFRDIELHPRDNDLVGASFGRGFYVLDDYSPLRDLSRAIKEKTNILFTVRDAWWYIPSEPMQAKGSPTLGSDSFVAENPPYGALLTYYLTDVPQSRKEKRKASEKSLREEGKNTPFPGWDQLEDELNTPEPQALLLIRDKDEQPVRWLKSEAKEGLNRVSWDLRFAPPHPINLSTPGFTPPWAGSPQGPLVQPGTYSAQLYLYYQGRLEAQGSPQSFEVKPVPNLSQGTEAEQVSIFQRQTSELYRQISVSDRRMGEASERIRYLKAALTETAAATPELFAQLDTLSTQLAALRGTLNGDRARAQLNESSTPSISGRVGMVIYGHWSTRQNPTA
ncbi:MAG: glycosyl hydrolase, partial [Bacteroidota bacterium]